MNLKLPKSYHNRISYIGTIISLINILLMFVFAIVSAFRVESSLYDGLYLFLVLPSFLVFGLFLIPVGMFFNIRKSKRNNTNLIEKSLVIDLNNKHQRNALVIFAIGTLLFVVFTMVGSYEAFHYTESNNFCGTMCHTVMEPEYNAYQNSSHAKVMCVECHIGSGAEWFVKAKISGLYQVYSVLFDKYPTPIPTPIHNLRPAKETCEQCHWPQKFYPNLLRSKKHYLTDEANTEWNIDLKIKVGTTHNSKDLKKGIHWHINNDVKIEYITTDEKREMIPYVRSINLATNDTVIFENTMDPITKEGIDTIAFRTMDCLDCHNRPAHNFNTPQQMIDYAMADGEISKSLPNIKSISMELLFADYSTTDSALMVIENKITAYYKDKYPEIFKNDKALIDKAIARITKDFQNNFFPEMKANWDSYPVHIGHKTYLGCFRCHSGTHQSKDGELISKDCNLCHAIMSQGSDSLEVAPFNGYLEFKHPVDIDGEWKENLCSDCHRNLF